MEFTNPYQENLFEDLTVNQQQAEFEKQMFQQQQATTLEGLRGAAGGSGIAALAQAMANQGRQQAQQASISIGMQETANRQMRLQGEQQRQQGEALIEEKEMNRHATLLVMQMGQLSGANQAVAQAQQNLAAAGAAQASMYGQQAAAGMQAAGSIFGAGMSAAGTYGAAKLGGGSPGGGFQLQPGGHTYTVSGVGSDVRLKKNINKIGESPSGLNIYSFEYIDSKYGKGLFQGVISDEIPQEAVTKINGYDHVYYSMLDVEFKQI